MQNFEHFLQTHGDIQRIANHYYAWRGDKGTSVYADVAGFCKSSKVDELRANAYILTPGRYVGSEEISDDLESFEERMKVLKAELNTQIIKSNELDLAIRASLELLGYEN
jgi:type I restriction enzyme M protein